MAEFGVLREYDLTKEFLNFPKTSSQNKTNQGHERYLMMYWGVKTHSRSCTIPPTTFNELFECSLIMDAGRIVSLVMSLKKRSREKISGLNK